MLIAQNDTRTISLSGTGKVEYKPNTITWSAQIKSIHKNMEDSRERIDVVFNRVKKKLRKAGIESKNIILSNNRQQKSYDYRNGKRYFTGYESSVNLSIKTKKISLYQRVNDILVTADEITVHNSSYSHDDPARFEAEAMKRAIQHAKRKANLIASELGLELGKAIKVTESSSNYIPAARRRVAMDMAYAKAESQVDVKDHMGKSSISYKIHITFSIKPPKKMSK